MLSHIPYLQNNHTFNCRVMRKIKSVLLLAESPQVWKKSDQVHLSLFLMFLIFRNYFIQHLHTHTHISTKLNIKNKTKQKTNKKHKNKKLQSLTMH